RFDTLDELRARIRQFAHDYREHWLLERHGYRTPRQARDTLRQTAPARSPRSPTKCPVNRVRRSPSTINTTAGYASVRRSIWSNTRRSLIDAAKSGARFAFHCQTVRKQIVAGRQLFRRHGHTCRGKRFGDAGLGFPVVVEHRQVRHGCWVRSAR
ncbi:MAG: hypothetical protein M3Q08_18305, partial [Pseudomonadota bacterium]|nr:hypothetical protein [Pseudomonadota bacterium]